MKKFLLLMAIYVTIALVSLPLAYGQEKAAPEKAAPQAEKTFQGQLMKVDANAKTISVKGAGDAEMLFQYNDRTQVVGQKDIQGLATETGTQLRVTYREAGPDSHMATKIEIVDRK